MKQTPAGKRAREKYNRANPYQKTLERVRQRAKKLGVPCDLDIDDIKSIFQVTICPVFKIPLTRNYGGHGLDNSPSIDRIQNHLGYVKGNVRCISNRANILKRDATQQELILIAMDATQIEMNRNEDSSKAA